jgi:hypothetical protein
MPALTSVVGSDSSAFLGECRFVQGRKIEAREFLMLNRILMAVVLTIVIATGGISAAQAQQPISLGQPAAPGWNFEVAPYVWFANVSNIMNFNLPPELGGGTASTDTSIGFGDIVSHLNFTTMVAADAQYDRFSLLTDFIYLNLSGTASRFRSVRPPNGPSIPISTGVQADVSMNLTNSIWTLAGGYTLAKGSWGNFDAIVGFRYLALHATLDHSIGIVVGGPLGNSATFGRGGSVSASTELWNGIGGFRGRVRLGTAGLFIPYYFDIGAGGSNLTWQIASGLGYHTRLADLSLTYRYLTFDQASDAKLQTMTVKGPMLAVTFAF